MKEQNTKDNKSLPKDKMKQPKGCLTFKLQRKLTNGYRTIEMADGSTYDYVGVEVDTKEGNTVTVALEVLPNGIYNMYVISSLYEIQQLHNFHRTIGKLVFIGKKAVVVN